jgi:hypothetical protein
VQTIKEPKLNLQYIYDNYNLEVEKQDINFIKHIKTILWSDFDGLTVKEFKKQCEILLDGVDEEAIIDIEFFGYDGAYDFLINSEGTRKETDDECAHRLLKHLRLEKTLKKKLEKAANLLKENGCDVKINDSQN